MAEGLEFRVDASDKILARFGNQLAALGGGLAKTVMARALNHEGDKARTQVKRVLVKQTGINYNLIDKAVSTYRAHQGKLSYTIQARGSETNLGLFNARATQSGVSAAPWGMRRIFRSADGERGSFLLPGTKLVFIRTGKASHPIKPLFGPNIARELVRDESKQAFSIITHSIAQRMAHEIARELK